MQRKGFFFFILWPSVPALISGKEEKEIIVQASFQSRKFSNLISSSNLIFFIKSIIEFFFSKYIIPAIKFAKFSELKI